MQNVMIRYVLVWCLHSLLIYFIERRNYLRHVATTPVRNGGPPEWRTSGIGALGPVPLLARYTVLRNF